MNLVNFEELITISRSAETAQKIQAILGVTTKEAAEWIELELQRMEQDINEEQRARKIFDPTWPERKAQREQQTRASARAIAEEIESGKVNLDAIADQLEKRIPRTIRKTRKPRRDMSLFRRLFMPREVHAALDLLDELERKWDSDDIDHEWDSEAFGIIRQHVEQVIFSSPNKFAKVIRKGRALRLWVLVRLSHFSEAVMA